MIKLRKSTLTVVFCLLATTYSEAQVNAVDVCYSMAQNALHNITVSQTNDAAVSATFSNYCYADGSTNDNAINASGNAVVQGLPIGAAFASKDKATRFKQFCSQYQSSSAVSNNQYNYSNLVLSRGLDSVNDCLRAAGGQFSLSYKTLTPSTMVINFSIPAGQSITVNGIKPDNGVQCTGYNFGAGGGIVTYDQGTKETINSTDANGSITCTRDPSGVINGNQFYSDKAVVVSTNVGPLNIFWAQDSVFPIVTASSIQNNMNALQAQISQVQASETLNTLPVGSILPWFSTAAPPKGWALCDGNTAGVPNLKGRFLRGANGDFGGSGGSDTQSVYVGAYRPGTVTKDGDGNGFNSGGTNYRVQTVPFSIDPPYTNINYIMKVS
ncbi:phage tail protein [Edaphobacter modestus]|nr:phage tail protein [Edaphobacter modestus]